MTPRNERTYSAQSREVVTSRTECPYGANSCPKVEEIEERVAHMEKSLSKMMTTLYFIAGVVSVTLGVQIL